MRDKRVVVVGAGVGGLTVALDLALRGLQVQVLERAAGPGGKMRQVMVDGVPLDGGPTVFTMRWVFDQLFAEAGYRLEQELPLQRAGVLARHAWSARERLDLHADLQRSAEAIGAFSGAAEARRFLEFSARSRRVYASLEHTFLRASRPASPTAFAGRFGARGLGRLWRIAPFDTLWKALGKHFHDPRLRQLFGRYATYCGASPFLAPATLMLIAHVEQDGVWLVEGGMHQVARTLERLARARGVHFRYGAEVRELLTAHGRTAGVSLADGEHIAADAVVVNADASALWGGHLGAAAAAALPRPAQCERSLSALVWTLRARTEGFPLLRHSVFFSPAYAEEFDDILRRGRPPVSPTVYVCAQDRGDSDHARPEGDERLLCLVNAPARGDSAPLSAGELEQSGRRAFALMERCGLRVECGPGRSVLTDPAAFDRLFPGTGGALYGQASHGWKSTFSRPGARTCLPGLYLAGGSTHPGPGVPMSALSGRLAAEAVTDDLTSGGVK